MRYPSIDILRTCALFVMVLVHFGENLSGYQVPFAGLGAPLFAFLSGMSYCLWAKGLEAKGRSETEIQKVSIRRGLFVFGVGFAFNILVWLPEDAFNWDVLTFIGTALILLNFARRLPLPISVIAAILAVAVSPLLRLIADYNSYWTEGYFDPDLIFSDLIIGFLSTGYFPIFPWIAFSLTGFVTGSVIFAKSEEAEEEESEPSTFPVILLGASFIFSSFLLLQARPYLPEQIFHQMLGGWTMFPPTIEYVLGTLGMALLLFGIGHRWIDLNPRAKEYQPMLDVAKMFSRNAFTIYILHHIVHLWPLWIYATLTGYETTYFWMQAMPVTVSLALALVFMLCCYAGLKWLGPNRTYGIEAWMRWLCD